MVVLEIVEHRSARPVVNELRALVEERRVVFVRFNHELLTLAQSRRHVEIARYAADQNSRLHPRIFQQPGEDARRRRLAMRTCDGHGPAIGEQVAREPLGPRGVRDAAVEQRFDERIAATHDVADDDDIRIQLQLLGVVAFDEIDAHRSKLLRHGRINALIRPRDAMAQLTRQRGDASHECAADAEDMKVHEE